jgi:hypothetical protein
VNRFAQTMMAAVLIVGGLTMLSACESGSYWDPNTKQLHSDKVGRLEATGEDLRIYEFTPQTAPKTQCVFVAGDRKAGLVCFPKP